MFTLDDWTKGIHRFRQFHRLGVAKVDDRCVKGCGTSLDREVCRNGYWFLARSVAPSRSPFRGEEWPIAESPKETAWGVVQS